MTWLTDMARKIAPCPPCELEHVEQYVTSEERAARLDRLRDSAMSSWEGALTWGDGNYLSRVYAPMLVGLVDIARAAEALAEHPGDEVARRRVRHELADYLRDLDTAKRAEQRDREWAAERGGEAGGS